MPNVVVAHSQSAESRLSLVRAVLASHVELRTAHTGEEVLSAVRDGDIDGVVMPLRRARVIASEHGWEADVVAREDPRDALLASGDSGVTLETVPPGTRVAVASDRQSAWLRAFRADLEPVRVERGPEAAVAALDSGTVGVAIARGSQIVAAGYEDRIEEWLERTSWMPSPGQGILVVLRKPGTEPFASSGPAQQVLSAELRVVDRVGQAHGDELGVIGLPYGPNLRLWGLVASADGRRAVRADLTGRLDESLALADRLADLLIERGASELLLGDDGAGAAG